MTFGTSDVGPPRLSSAGMNQDTQSTTTESGRRDRPWAELSSGLAILCLCVGVGVVVLLLGPDPYIPSGWWLLLLITCVTSGFLAVSGTVEGRGNHLVYAAAVLSSWALLLSVPSQGMLVVLLVAVAAVGTYIVPVWAALLVVLLNCAVILGALVFHGAGPAEYLAATIFYAIIHLASILSTYALQREARLRAELEQANVQLTAASLLLEDSARSAERLRISRELHDLIGHQLTVLNLELEAAKHREGAPGRAHVEQAAEVAKELLGSVRTTVGEMRAAESSDLSSHLTRLADAVPSLRIVVDVDPGVHLQEQHTAAFVRAAQEIITNAVKHSEAQVLTLEVQPVHDSVVLTGSNDGLAPTSVSPGHGLLGLRERVELLGGRLEVTSHPRFSVEVSLPCGATVT